MACLALIDYSWPIVIGSYYSACQMLSSSFVIRDRFVNLTDNFHSSS
jgi:hypothetical protein